MCFCKETVLHLDILLNIICQPWKKVFSYTHGDNGTMFVTDLIERFFPNLVGLINFFKLFNGGQWTLFQIKKKIINIENLNITHFNSSVTLSWRLGFERKIHNILSSGLLFLLLLHHALVSYHDW